MNSAPISSHRKTSDSQVCVQRAPLRASTEFCFLPVKTFRMLPHHSLLFSLSVPRGYEHSDHRDHVYPLREAFGTLQDRYHSPGAEQWTTSPGWWAHYSSVD